MSIFATLRRFFGNSERSVQILAEIREGIANDSDHTRRLLTEIRDLASQTGSTQGQSELAESLAHSAGRMEQLLLEIREGIANSGGRMEQALLEIREGNVHSAGRMEQVLLEIREGIANSDDRSAQILSVIRAEIAGGTTRSEQVLAEIREGVANGSDRSTQLLSALMEGVVGGESRAEQVLREIREGVANSSDRSTQLLSALMEGVVGGDSRSEQLLHEIREGVANDSDRSTEILLEIRKGIAKLSDIVDRHLGAMVRNTAVSPSIESIDRIELVLREIRSGLAAPAGTALPRDPAPVATGDRPDIGDDLPGHSEEPLAAAVENVPAEATPHSRDGRKAAQFGYGFKYD
jgi:hypothetical protein